MSASACGLQANGEMPQRVPVAPAAGLLLETGLVVAIPREIGECRNCVPRAPASLLASPDDWASSRCQKGPARERGALGLRISGYS